MLAEHRYVHGASNLLTNWSHQAAQLAQVGISDYENIDIAVRPTDACGPRAVDYCGVNIGAIKGRAQLLLDANRTTQ